VSAVHDGVKLRRTWPQRLFILANSLVVLCCFAAAAALTYVDAKAGQLKMINLGHVLTSDVDGATTSGPLNILMVGVDNAEGLDPEDPIRYEREAEGVGGLRSDTIMVLRLVPDSGQASLLSFPRDLWVTIGDTSRHDRINAAMSLGGPETLIKTITNNFDIPIDHYVQVDFAQFKRLVDVIGGVRVYFDQPARDANTGLLVPEPGCVNLTGDQALAYARSRYYEYFDGDRWHFDGTADLGRISRQQDFIKRALRRAVSKGLRNPITLNRLVNTGLDAVTVDERFQASDILSLANRFRSFDPEDLTTLEVPVYNDSVGGASIVRLIESEAEPVLDVFRGRDPANLAPADVPVRVLNGSGRPGEGRAAGEALRGAGFDVVGVGDADSSDHVRSVIRHGPDDRAAADLLARHLEGSPSLEEAPELTDGVIELVTGTEYAGTREEPLPPTTTTATTAPSTTSSSAPADGATTTVPAEVTTTSRYGVVPGDTDAAADCR
jgi:LCP family protein required for cell wall assembly